MAVEGRGNTIDCMHLAENYDTLQNIQWAILLTWINFNPSMDK